MEEEIRELAYRFLALDPNLTEREAFSRARLEVDRGADIDNIVSTPERFRADIETEARRLMLVDSSLSEADAVSTARARMLSGGGYGQEVEVNRGSSVFSEDFLNGLQQTGFKVPSEIVNQNPVMVDEMQRDGLTPPVVESGVGLETPPPSGTRYEPSFMNLPFFYGGGTSPTYRAYQLGSFAGSENIGGVERGLGILGSAGALTLGLGREFMSGFANTRRTERTLTDAQENQRRRTYTDNRIYGDRNVAGGVSVNKFGGRIVSKPDKRR